MKPENMKSIVRRLTPLECERLMGFPDDYLDVGDGKGGPTPDSPRYKACGNSWGVNCAAWVMKRIHEWDTAHGGRGITNYATVCSGVEAQSLALKACGIDARGVFFSEIEPFPCRVLTARYPSVPNLGDMTKIQIKEKEITNGTITVIRPDELDLFSGGDPLPGLLSRRKARRRSARKWNALLALLDLARSYPRSPP